MIEIPIWLFGFASGLAGLAIGMACTLWINSRAEKIVLDEDKYLEEYGFSPKECRETHLGGDCPLCGGR